MWFNHRFEQKARGLTKIGNRNKIAAQKKCLKFFFLGKPLKFSHEPESRIWRSAHIFGILFDLVTRIEMGLNHAHCRFKYKYTFFSIKRIPSRWEQTKNNNKNGFNCVLPSTWPVAIYTENKTNHFKFVYVLNLCYWSHTSTVEPNRTKGKKCFAWNKNIFLIQEKYVNINFNCTFCEFLIFVIVQLPLFNIFIEMPTTWQWKRRI